MKRQKLWKKCIAVILTGAMCASLAAGCGSSQTQQAESTTAKSETTVSGSSETTQSAEAGNVGITYPIENAGSFTFGMPLSSSWSDRFSSFDTLPLGKALEAATGFDMEMVHVENNNAMNLLIASGELPDVVLYDWKTGYSGGEAKAVEDGVIQAMTPEFVQQYAPDYWEVINSDPDIRKQVTTADGNIWGFAFIIKADLLKGGYGLIIRDDWCEELGIGIPETADDFYNMLKAFKEEKGIEVPMSMDWDNLSYLMERGIITSPFGLVKSDIYVDNGQVKIGFAQQEYKAVLEWLHKLYEEELLDPNFSTLDTDTLKANILSGASGATGGNVNGSLGSWLTTNKEAGNYSLKGIRNLVAKSGDTPMAGIMKNSVIGKSAVITSSCKNPELLAQFLNYGYTEEGHLLYCFGTEGESYNMVDGKAIFTDYILNNPNGLTIKQAQGEYVMSGENGPFVQDENVMLQTVIYDAQKEALYNWIDNDGAKYLLPEVTISAEDINEYSSLKSEIEAYVDEMSIKFIMGTESLDNYDDYLNNLKSMGLSRLQEITQAALDEYNAR